jgi:hypothetical protein
MDLDYNKKCFPGAIANHINYGSTPELVNKNIYTCPKIWCPKSKVAMTMEQFVAQGRKCPFPGITEEPMLAKKAEDTDTRSVAYLSAKNHPNNLCMPCCSLKPLTNDNNKCTSKDVGSKLYIKQETYPLDEGRYGILNQQLTKLFKNDNCGGKTGTHGLMNSKTNCYLRYGMPLANNQSFLQTMVSSLNNDKITSVNDIVAAITQNLSVELFLHLNNGIVAKSFLPMTNTITDLDDFNAFKTWFVGRKQVDYIQRFSLSVTKEIVTRLKYFNALVMKQNITHYNDIMREFQIYQAFTNFMTYMNDNNVRKKHDYLYHLFNIQLPWLNVNGYNLVVIDTNTENGDPYVSCPIYQTSLYFDKERPSIIVLKESIFYEPIHYVRQEKVDKKTTLNFDQVHGYSDNSRVNKFFKSIIKTCLSQETYFDKDAIQIRTSLDASTHRVKAQILDFKFHVIAYYTETEVLIPLKKPTLMDNLHPSTFMFIDTCIRNYDTSVTEKVVKGVLSYLNKFVPDYYVAESSLKDKKKTKVALKLKDIELLIPLVPFKSLEKSGVYDSLIKDGDVFVMYEVDDERKRFVAMIDYIESLFIAFKNEVVNYLIHNPSKKEVIDMMRHPSNPLPLVFKRIELAKLFNESVIRRLVHNTKNDPNVKFGAPTCNNIGSMTKCKMQGQCAWYSPLNSENELKGFHCKLSVPIEYTDLLLERIIEFLLNPISKIELEMFYDSTLVDQSTLNFTSSDVEIQGIDLIISKMNDTNTSSYNVQNTAIVDVDDLAEEYDPLISKTLIDKPTIMSSLTAFTLHAFDNNNWIYDFFVNVYNRLNPNNTMTVVQFKQLVYKKIKSNIRENKTETIKVLSDNPSFVALSKNLDSVEDVILNEAYHVSDYEVAIMSKIAMVNVFITNLKSTKMPDTMRCLGKYQKDYFVMLHQKFITANKQFVFYLYVKNNKKYLLTAADFDPQFSKCVKVKCAKVVDVDKLPSSVCPPYK